MNTLQEWTQYKLYYTVNKLIYTASLLVIKWSSLNVLVWLELDFGDEVVFLKLKIPSKRLYVELNFDFNVVTYEQSVIGLPDLFCWDNSTFIDPPTMVIQQY